MSIAYVVLAVLLSLMLVVSGRGKLVKDPKVMAVLEAVGVASGLVPVLAVLEFAGALGLLVGIGYRPLGVAAAVGVVLYFLGAVIAHLRVKDVKGVPGSGVLLVVSAAELALAAATM
ncbi:DoxX family protein [Streptomyces sp. TRM S81-3]|uniref:DoxX family protein n=1 Tax=Streptomyces griseicoloratus TaxID=2752516 RepID=A0A926L582_9ACTN|nr:DoxX family protein [Streptomyces griseicoloratus]MBD0421649.1 DoxX family protein [Streptomyces griseicoloratus]